MTRWFALQTLPQQEENAKVSLERMGVNAQYPVAVERRVRHRRSATIRQEVEKPMMPGYIFVEVPFLPDWFYQERHLLRALPSWHAPRSIPDALVRNALGMSGQITINEWREVQQYFAGDSVRHRASGLTGKVDEVRGKKLVLLVELLGKLHRRTVPVEHVEAAE